MQRARKPDFVHPEPRCTDKISRPNQGTNKCPYYHGNRLCARCVQRYKQTGFCGFGDSCKFLHDRSDYKQGWQLDREWEIVTKGRKIGATVVANANRSKVEEEDDDKDAMLDGIPFACIICKGPYREPVVTRCSHY